MTRIQAWERDQYRVVRNNADGCSLQTGSIDEAARFLCAEAATLENGGRIELRARKAGARRFITVCAYVKGVGADNSIFD